MVMVGADPDELDRLAHRLESEARRLEQLGGQLSRQLQVAPWRGGRADRFRGEWRSVHMRQLRDAAGFLRHGRDVLAHNADQQRNASNGAGGSIGGGIGHGPGHHPADVPHSIAMLLRNSHDPRAVREAWDHLTPTERAAIIRAHPEIIGNLDGIPPQARFQINRMRVSECLDTLPPGDPMRKVLTPYATGKEGPSQILFFDPTGDGRIAVVRGNLDTARNVAVVVPGIGNEMSGFGGMVGDADRLRYASGNGGRDTAVVAWLGYDTPPGVNSPGVIAAAGTGMALVGAPLLVSMVGGLRTSTGAPITIIGHSYGSLVTGEAAKRGLDADRIVFIGSPGTGAETVGDLHLRPGTQVYAGAVEGDPVSNLRHFGNDPTDQRFGAIAFDAGNPGGIDPLKFPGLHSQYYTPNSESLINLGNIVSGRPVTLDHASRVEQLVSDVRFVDKTIDRGVDFVQGEVHVPFLDHSIDRVVDFGQHVKGGGARVIEFGGEVFDDVGKKTSALFEPVTPSWKH